MMAIDPRHSSGELALPAHKLSEPIAAWEFGFLPNAPYAIQLRCPEDGTVITAQLRWVDRDGVWLGCVACSDGGNQKTQARASWHDADAELSDLTQRMCATQQRRAAALSRARVGSVV